MIVVASLELVTIVVVNLIIAAALIALAELLRPKPKTQDAKPAGLGDFKFPTAIEGRAIPIVWGTVQIAGPNVVWWGDLNSRKQTESIKTGLWSSKRITTGFEYDIGLQMALCLGRVDRLTRIWVGDVVVAEGLIQDGTYLVDDPKLFGGGKFGNGGMVGTFRVHSGSPTQDVNAYLSTKQDPCVPHRGVCYVVWERGYVGNSSNIKPMKFEVIRNPNGLGLPDDHHIVNGDANPACVIYEWMTDDDWGLGIPAGDIDTASFLAAGETLFTEGNGFGFILDRFTEGVDLLKLIQEQIDGVVYLDPTDGKFHLSLARADYDVDLIPQLEDPHILEVQEFARGTWEQTSNQVRVKYTDRSRDYFDTFAPAHDLGNQRIQGGELVSLSLDFPGVKTPSLAAYLASRELRQLSVPLAKATVVVDRTFYGLTPNSVVAWTDANLGFLKLPMRVLRIDYGSLDDGRIVLQLVQDVFKFSAAFFGTPSDTFWEPPTQEVEDLPESLVMEAPYAISRRDPEQPLNPDRIWAGARRKTGGESAFKIWQRNAAGTPSGAYTEDSDDIPNFLLIGKLRTALVPSNAAGAATVLIDPDPDTLAAMLAAFSSGAAAADIGTNLVNLCYIDSPDGEFFSPSVITNAGDHLSLTGCWRGMLDTVPGYHSAGVSVYLMFAGGDLNQAGITQGFNVDVQLRAESLTDETTEGEADTVSLTLNDRARRPYPPTQLQVNAAVFPSSASLDVQAPSTSGLDDKGLNFIWNRRDFEVFNEAQGIEDDAEAIDPTFPAKHSTAYDLDLEVSAQDTLGDYDAYWKLDEASGTRFDESANDFDLADNNTVTAQTGKIGNAAEFLEANNEFLEAAAASVLNYNGNASFSFVGWLRLASKVNPRAFVAKWNANGAGPQRQYALLYDTGSDRLQFLVSSDGTTFTTVTATKFGSPSVDTWYFFHIEHDADKDTIRISINNGTYDVAAHSAGVFNGSAKLRLGALQGGSGEDAFQLSGMLDEIGAWPRAMTAFEVSFLYNATAGRTSPFSGTLDLHALGFNSGEGEYFLSRTAVIQALNGGIPEALDVTIRTRHEFGGPTRAALQELFLALTIAASELSDDTWLGQLDQNIVSGQYLAPETGTYDIEIGQTLSGNVEVQLNGGGFSAVITSGNTTGTVSVTAGDIVEVRHTAATAGTLVQLTPPTSTLGAYGVLL